MSTNPNTEAHPKCSARHLRVRIGETWEAFGSNFHVHDHVQFMVTGTAPWVVEGSRVDTGARVVVARRCLTRRVRS